MSSPQFVNQEELLDSILHISPRVDWENLRLNEAEAFILSRATGILSIREIAEQTDLDIKQILTIVNEYLKQGILLIEKRLPQKDINFSLSEIKHIEQKTALRRAQEIKTFENFEIKFPFGDLSEYHFPKILMYAIYSKFSGKIEIEDQRQMRIISFDSGMVCDVRSIPIVLQECLGRIMLAKGEISFEQYQQSLKLMAKSHKRQGEILIQMKAATEKDIENALRLQAEIKLSELFSWESGSYKLKPGAKINRSFPNGVDIISVTYIGAKEKSPLEMIRKEIKNYQFKSYEFANPSLFTLLKKIVKEDEADPLIILERQRGGQINDLLSSNRSAISYIITYILLLLGVIRIKREER